MLSTLGIIIAICVAATMLLLLWPVRVRVHAGDKTGWMEVRYFIWSIRRDVVSGTRETRIAGIRLPARKPRPPKPRREKPTVRKPKVEIPWQDRARTAWAHRPVIRRVIVVLARLVGRLIRSWHLERGRLSLAYGLGDPGQTGMLTGFLFASRPALLALLPKWRIGLQPNFEQAQFAAELDMSLRLIPIQPVIHIGKALGTLPWRGVWKLKTAWNEPFQEEPCQTT